MNPVTVSVTFIAVAGLLAGLRTILSRNSRRRLLEKPAPAVWIDIMARNLPLTARLSEEQKQRLFGFMHLFLSAKRFEGCGGLQITEEIKVTIAAQACLLLIGRNTKIYPKLKTILVYPHTYQSGRQGIFGGDNGPGARLGESWTSGVVVLAWNSVLGGAANIEDGDNVTLHEFAHQLDQEDGIGDGAPILEQRSGYVEWARIFQREYNDLIAATDRGRKSTLDSYGATNPAEFFAVATETFFEKPRQLKREHPELYKELRIYYHLDPEEWTRPVG